MHEKNGAFLPQEHFRTINHENGLFHFLHDHHQSHELDSLISGSHCEVIKSPTNEHTHYLLFKTELTPISFAIFPGYTLDSCHLRVDKYTPYATDSSHRVAAQHITLTYTKNDENPIKVHLYCARNGHPVQPQPWDAFVENGNRISLQQLQMAYLYQQITPLLDLLQTMVVAKNNQLLGLKEDILRLKATLALLKEDSTSATETIQELWHKVQCRDRYNQVKSTESIYYERYLQPPTCGPIAKDSTTAMQKLETTESIPSLQAKVTTPPSKPRSQKKQQKDTFMTQVDRIVPTKKPRQSQDIAAWFVEHVETLQTLQMMILEYPLEPSFISHHLNRLPKQGQLMTFFSEELGKMNLEVVRMLAPHMEDTCELYNLLNDFLKGIDTRQDDTQAMRITIAKALHETSMTYQQVLLNKAYALKSSDQQPGITGILPQLVFTGNLAAFEMYIDQGFPIDTLQWLYNNKALNIIAYLETAILLDSQNIDGFVDAIFDHPSIKNVISTHVLALNPLNYRINDQAVQFSKKTGYFWHDGQRTQTLNFILAKRAITSLESIIDFIPHQTGWQTRQFALISRLATALPPELLIRATMELFEKPWFLTLYSPLPSAESAAHPFILDRPDDLSYIKQQLIKTENTSESMSVIFSMAPQTKLTRTATIYKALAQTLLTECINVVQKCSHQQQSQMLDNFYQIVLHSLKIIKNSSTRAQERQLASTSLIASSRAAIFAGLSMKDPSVENHVTLFTVGSLLGIDGCYQGPTCQQADTILLSNLRTYYSEQLDTTRQNDLLKRIPEIINAILLNTDARLTGPQP